MTKYIFIIATLLASFLFISCDQEEELTPEILQVNVEKKNEPVQISSFSPPSYKTVITLEKAKQYVDASAGLVLLGAKWSEEIEKASDQEKIKILNAYNLAREQVCAKVGLAGVAEYEWITNVALKNPQNEQIFKEAGLRVK